MIFILELLPVFALEMVCRMRSVQHQGFVKVVVLYSLPLSTAMQLTLIRHCSCCFGIDVGSIHLTDINYADDAVLFTEDAIKWDMFYTISRGQQVLWVCTRIGSKQRSRISELKILQPHFISTTRQWRLYSSSPTLALIQTPKLLISGDP